MQTEHIISAEELWHQKILHNGFEAMGRSHDVLSCIGFSGFTFLLSFGDPLAKGTEHGGHLYGSVFKARPFKWFMETLLTVARLIFPVGGARRLTHIVDN